MKHVRSATALAAAAIAAFAFACTREPSGHGAPVLRWMERPGSHGPSTAALPGDVVQFARTASYDPGADFRRVSAGLREGDAIAYRMTHGAARAAIARGADYICSTVVLAAYYYSGVELDAVRNRGWLDICTPYQVVSSKGRVTAPPPVALATEDAPTTATVPIAGEQP